MSGCVYGSAFSKDVSAVGSACTRCSMEKVPDTKTAKFLLSPAPHMCCPGLQPSWSIGPCVSVGVTAKRSTAPLILTQVSSRLGLQSIPLHVGTEHPDPPPPLGNMHKGEGGRGERVDIFKRWCHFQYKAFSEGVKVARKGEFGESESLRMPACLCRSGIHRFFVCLEKQNQCFYVARSFYSETFKVDFTVLLVLMV